MRAPLDSSRRNWIGISTLLGVSLIALIVWIRWMGAEKAVSHATSTATPASATPESPAGLAALDSPGQRHAVSGTPETRTELAHSAEPTNTVEARQSSPADLIAQLEVLAKTPQTFHAKALPLIERLTEACSEGIESDAAGVAGRGHTMVQDLLQTLVLDPSDTVLVRGAVFLALTPKLSESEFWSVFDAWFSGDRSIPLELLRTAALASTRLGSPAPCKYPLPLEQLAKLPTSTGSALPGFYALALDRIAPDRACDAIRLWLDSGDPRRALFQVSTSPPGADVDLKEAGDYFVTSEILFCVWGHQALRNPTVEHVVIQEALAENEGKPGSSLVCVRAANFLVYALAMCDSAFFEIAAKMGSAKNPVAAAMARTMESLALDGLGVGLVARIETLRYSTAPKDEADLMRILKKVGDSLGQATKVGAEPHMMTLDYLGGLVKDTAVAETARATAFSSLAKGGAWSATKDAAHSLLSRNNDLLLTALALNSLMDNARKEPARRTEVLAILNQFAAQGPPPKLRPSVETYLAELAR